MSSTSDSRKADRTKTSASKKQVCQELDSLKKSQLLRLIEALMETLTLEGAGEDPLKPVLRAIGGVIETSNCLLLEHDTAGGDAKIMTSLVPMKRSHIKKFNSIIQNESPDVKGQLISFDRSAGSSTQLSGYLFYPLNTEIEGQDSLRQTTPLFLGVLKQGGVSPEEDRLLQTLAAMAGRIIPLVSSLSRFQAGHELLEQTCRQNEERALTFERETGRQKKSLEELRGKVSELRRTREQLLHKHRELSEANKKLQEMDKLKSNFLAVASHELRTPISIIKGYNKMLLDETTGPINQVQQQLLTECKDGCDRLIKMINSMLDLSKIESGKMEMNFQKGKLDACLEEVIRAMRPMAAKKSIFMKSSVKSGVPEIFFDREKMERVLMNLLENAIKFTPAGGRIQVELRHFKDSHGGEAVKRTGGHPRESVSELEVVVSDTGIGINKAEQEGIFKEFRQVPNVSRLFKGSGLGLAIAKKIVEAHGGEIWVRSRPEEGSHFHFTLPMKRDGSH